MNYGNILKISSPLKKLSTSFKFKMINMTALLIILNKIYKRPKKTLCKMILKN